MYNKYINKLSYNLSSQKPEIKYGYFNKDKTFILSNTVSKQDIWNENKIYYVPTFGGVCRISNNFKEVMAFALLGYCTFYKIPNNVPSCTGAEKSVVMGKITYPI